MFREMMARIFPWLSAKHPPGPLFAHALGSRALGGSIPDAGSVHKWKRDARRARRRGGLL